ncbi:MAG: DNA repair protein RadA [Alphaproteobacteria bacterium]|nr:DNA repair protein RadA [Alphaproteobacteria bacterium]
MAKPAERFVCQQCGAVQRKWAGQCAACGAWNSMAEEPGESGPRQRGLSRGRPLAFASLAGLEAAEPPRVLTGNAEFDRVTGGGLVPGSAVLIGGDPGIGKSTLLLQVTAALAGAAVGTAYVSGEEAVAQLRMRARRLGLSDAPVQLAAATDVGDVLASLEGRGAPRVVVIDSIQTMFVESLESAPGTVAQVRMSAQELIRAAKRRDTTLLLVGHVTKDGQIAGPRVLEHMVDTVLYFEGERGHQFRILRAVKNRYGPTDEIGVFEMTDRGLAEVPNPSALFLSDRRGEGVTGAAVFAGMEGTRPLLVEVQALVAQGAQGSARRTVVGWDANRLAMLIAVLDARCGLSLSGRDVYLNVAGGLRINEPAADLAVAAALLSSLADRPVPAGAVLFGEVGLSGEVRPVGQAELRLKEAAKLGFQRAFVPAGGRGREAGVPIAEIETLSDLVGLLSPELADAGAEPRR